MRRVVIGVGNAYRGDDGAGPAVVERLRALVPADVEVVVCEEEPTRLMEAWDGAGAVFIVDAVASDSEPGQLHRFDASGRELPARVFRSSTHAFGIGEAIELSRALGSLPARVLVYGIEGASFEAGDELSPAAADSVGRTVEAVLEDMCTSAG